MRIRLVVVSCALLSGLAACSDQHVYGIGQAWQRNACFKINDVQERERCLDTANTPYYEYKRQAGDIK